MIWRLYELEWVANLKLYIRAESALLMNARSECQERRGEKKSAAISTRWNKQKQRHCGSNKKAL